VNIIQLLLILVGLVVTAGGVVMLVRGAGRDSSGRNLPRPYLTLGIIAVGLVIVYHTVSDYQTMDGVEVIGLFFFGLAFGTALAIKMLIVDRFDFDAGHVESDSHDTPQSNNSSDKEAGGGGS
jgi:4-hydroxybenzoate polyprenyltransferase